MTPSRHAVVVFRESPKGGGGLARITSTQRRILEEYGWTVHAITPGDIPCPWQSRRLSALNFLLEAWQLGRLTHGAAAHANAVFSHQFHFDLGGPAPRVHLYHATSMGLALACRSRQSQLEYCIRGPLANMSEIHGGRRAARFAVSELVQRECASYHRRAKTRILHNAIDVAHFAPMRPAPHRGDAFVGLCVGRLDYGKGRGTLSSLGRLLDNRHCLRIAGGDLRADLHWPEGRSRRLELVDYQGMPSVYHSADYLLCASRYEGFGLTLVEAWACGKPVVTTNIGIVGELRGLEPTLDMMVVDDPDDVNGFAQRIRSLHANPEVGRRQAEWGRSIVEERFSLDRMRAAYAAILEAIP